MQIHVFDVATGSNFKLLTTATHSKLKLTIAAYVVENHVKTQFSENPPPC